MGTLNLTTRILMQQFVKPKQLFLVITPTFLGIKSFARRMKVTPSLICKPILGVPLLLTWEMLNSKPRTRTETQDFVLVQRLEMVPQWLLPVGRFVVLEVRIPLTLELLVRITTGST